MRAVPTVLMSLMLAYTYQPQVLAAASEPQVNFKIYSPDSGNKTDTPATSDKDEVAPSAEQASTDNSAATPADSAKATDSTDTKSQAHAADADKTSESMPADDKSQAAKETSDKTSDSTDASADKTSNANTDEKSEGADHQKIASKVLQGYVRVVPTGTKVPIIMDTAVDSDTSQEGDEFSARTSEDLNIDGVTIVPAGSIIKGRIAQLNSPKRLNRSGSVALKFDTVTTPDNRQIPLVANIVARGGVVHARRGVKDIAIDCGVVAIPVAAGLGIGVIAGAVAKSSSIGPGGGALIGAGIGTALGVAILLAKKGKKIDVRPGDELKIELAEDLRMPMM